ncbi:MAG: ABC transporter permease [Candidatus Kapabacteria bacterium]|nr:ABC transporter permease [Candidatus Kapabacteria bacterium]MCS7170024.1 ABC transporter permease [Candidatus Kapabacteria bacterium]MDW7996698.1 ABC transporter permease [Bacteroidota bacterium]MDW8224670.1 ABC transporter permease [Bacteroidota bacterium]
MELVRFVGHWTLRFLGGLGRILLLLRSVLSYVPRVPKDWRLVIRQMAVFGVDSLPLVLLIGSFTGAIAALQATNLFDKFNLLELARPYLGSSIATVVFTELTPVLTALVIAGRVGGAIAAQLGTMAVSEQLDALEIMAIDRDRYLGMPRVVAALAMMPVLAVFSNLVAVVGALVLTTLKFGISPELFFDSIQRFFRTSELVLGLVKSAVFGGVTAIIGCAEGFATTGGAEGVGRSTVRAFTTSAATILVLDALFGYVL